MTPGDRRLCALLAAFMPGRAVELAGFLGGESGTTVRAAAEALVLADRSARLAELARALTPPDPVLASTATTGRSQDRMLERLRLELLSGS